MPASWLIFSGTSLLLISLPWFHVGHAARAGALDWWATVLICVGLALANFPMAVIVRRGRTPPNGGTLDIVGGLAYFTVLAVAVAVGGQVHRYRRVSGATEPRQTKWLVYGLGLSLIVSLVTSIPYFFPDTFPGLVATGSPYDRFQTVVSVLAIGIIPVCVASPSSASNSSTSTS